MFTNDDPLNSEDPLGLGLKKGSGKVVVCIAIKLCVNLGAQVDTVVQPVNAKGEAPVEQVDRKDEGTAKRNDGPAPTDQPVNPGGDYNLREVLQEISSGVHQVLSSPATKKAVVVGGAGISAWFIVVVIIGAPVGA